MYDIKWIRDNPEAFDRGLKRRGLEPLSQKLIALDEKRRAAISKSEQAQARRNAASKEIGEAKAKKDEATAQALMAEVATLKETMPALEAEEKIAGRRTRQGAGADSQPAARRGAGWRRRARQCRAAQVRRQARLCVQAEAAFRLGEALGKMDFELAAKFSGARFVVLQKGLARMERALGQFMLDLHTERRMAIPRSIRR